MHTLGKGLRQPVRQSLEQNIGIVVVLGGEFGQTLRDANARGHGESADVVRDTFEAEELVRNALLLVGAGVLGDTIRSRNALARAEVDAAQHQAQEAVVAERLQVARSCTTSSPTASRS